MLSIDSLEKLDAIQKKVTERGQTIGMKAANLQELSEITKTLNKEKQKLKVEVPSFYPIAHSPVLDYLNKHAPEWQKLWMEFVAEQRQTSSNQVEQESLTPIAIEKLNAIQTLIRDAFSNPAHPYKDEHLKKYLSELSGLDKNALLMVRSTGKEDNVDFANPGGNESIAAVSPTLQAVSQAMGIVVASYFSEKSITQRLISKDKVTSEPFMPVLVQKMIGERLQEKPTNKQSRGGADDSEDIVRSGVIYTSTGGIKIDVAPGHGELIVNSKGAFDSYYLGRENVPHEQRFDKPYRLVPIETDEIDKLGRKKRKLQLVKNPEKIRKEPSLPTWVAQRIALISRKIQEHYGREMDLEFVFEPKTEIIYLVQARPITSGDPRLEMPSSVPPEKIAQLNQLKKEGKIELEHGQVISPGKAVAKIITHLDEIIVTDTIEDALRIYLKPPKKPIQAVIVRELAPETSHEAALFNKMVIPVIQIKNKETIEEWLKLKNPVIMVDPQRSQIINWTHQLKSSEKTQKTVNTEKELVEEGFIKKGIFKSPVQLREKSIQLNFQQFKGIKGVADKSLKQAKKALKSEKLGELISQAKSDPNPDNRVNAFNQLMMQLYASISEIPLEQFKIDLKATPDLIKSSIENIEIVTKESIAKAREGLNNLLVVFMRLAKSKTALSEGSPHYTLFRSALITCAEMSKLLDLFSSDHPTNKEINDARKEIQQLASSLDAMVYNPGALGLISDSIKQIQQEEKALKKALNVPGVETLKPEELSYFVELMKLQKIALNQDLAKEWAEFALAASKDQDCRQLLASMIKFSLFNRIESDWINNCFSRHLKVTMNKEIAPKKDKMVSLLFQLTSKQAPLESKIDRVSSSEKPKQFPTIQKIKMKQILKGMMEEGLKTARELETLNLSHHQAILNTWEGRIGEWADPNKFESLYKDFSKELIPLIQYLKITPNMQPLAKNSVLKAVQQLTEIIDRTIKSLKGSPEYSEQNAALQVERFTILLDHYYKLMEQWVLQIPDEQLAKWIPYGSDTEYNRDKMKMLEAINNTFQKLRKKNDISQFSPSGSLNVASARIDSGTSFSRQFVDKSEVFTKEDLFTLFHQNIIACTVYLSQENRIPIQGLPSELIPLIKSLQSVSYQSPMELLNIVHNHPKINIDFNLTLRNHSAKFTVEYDYMLKQVKFVGRVFGHNANNRMNIIADMAGFDARLLGLKQIGKPFYNENSWALDFCWQFDAEKIPSIKDTLSKSLSNYGYLTFAPEDFLKDLIKRHPGKEAEIINTTQKYNREHQEIMVQFFKEVMEDPDKYKDDAIIALLDNLTAPILQQCIEKSTFDSVKLKSLFDKYNKKLKLDEKFHDFTLFESIAEKLKSKQMDEFIRLFEVDCKKHPNLLNIALSRGDIELFQYFQEKGALLITFNSQALLNGLKEPQLQELIIRELRNYPDKYQLTKQKDLVLALLGANLSNTEKESLIIEMLDRGAPYNACEFLIINQLQDYPKVFEKYMQHIKENFHQYSDAEKSDLMKLLLYEGESEQTLLSFIEMGFPLMNVQHLVDVQSSRYLTNSTVRKYVVDFLANNSKNGKLPDLNQILGAQFRSRERGFKQLIADCFDKVLENQIKCNIDVTHLANIANSRAGDSNFKSLMATLINSKLTEPLQVVKETLHVDLIINSSLAKWAPDLLGTGKIDLANLDFYNWIKYGSGENEKIFLEKVLAEHKGEFISSILSKINSLDLYNGFSKESKPQRDQFISIFNEMKEIKSLNVFLPEIYSALGKQFLKHAILEINNLKADKTKLNQLEKNLIKIQFLIDIGCKLYNAEEPHAKVDYTETGFKAKQEDELSPCWNSILNTPQLKFLLDKQYFHPGPGENLIPFARHNFELILRLLDTQPELVNAQSLSLLAFFIQNDNNIMAMLNHKNFKINPVKDLNYEMLYSIFRQNQNPIVWQKIYEQFLDPDKLELCKKLAAVFPPDVEENAAISHWMSTLKEFSEVKQLERVKSKSVDL